MGSVSMKRFLSLIAFIALSAVTSFAQVRPYAEDYNLQLDHVQAVTQQGNSVSYFQIRPGMTTHQVTFTTTPAIAVLTVAVDMSEDGTTSFVSCGTSSLLGATISCTGTYTRGRITITSFIGSGYVNIDYFGVSTAQGSGGGGGGSGGAVTNAGIFAVQAGQAADGAAVSGLPVRIAGKDGSGNTQDILTDTAGDQVMVGAGTAGTPAGGVSTVQGAASMTPLLATLSGTNNITTVTTVAAVTGITNALPAGTNLLGKTGIDQTTPGTTNLVYIKGTDGSSITATTDPCVGATKLSVPVNIVTATTVVVQAASASNKFYLCSMFLFASAADNVAVVEDATGSCASPDAGVIGGTTTATGIQLIANEGAMIQSGGATVAKTASTNVNFCLITSTTAQLTGVVTGVLAP